MGNQPPPARPPAESRWRCPCGYEGLYQAVLGHRRGWRHRPQCAGKIRPLDPSLLYAGISPDGSAGGAGRSEPEVVDTAEAPASGGLEGTGEEGDQGEELASGELEGTADPEELARRLNQSRQQEALAGAVEVPLDRELLTLGLEGSLPPGEWELETPPEAGPVSQAREAVALPPVVRMMYDWARSQGWHAGDGSMSAFITDIVLDHWQNCWGKIIVVVDRKDLEDAGSGSDQRGLPGPRQPALAEAVE